MHSLKSKYALGFSLWCLTQELFVSSFVTPSQTTTISYPKNKHFVKSKSSLSAASSLDTDPKKSQNKLTRASFLSSLVLFTGNLAVVAAAADAATEETTVDDEPPIPVPGKSYTITSCPTQASSACVSTASVRGSNLQSYVVPWSFECSPEKAFQTLVDILKSESNSIKITFMDPDALYLQATATRNLGVTDDLEFFVKKEDNVIVYRSSQTGSEDDNGSEKEINDLGANKKRLERLRKMSNGTFGIMGDMSGEDYFGAASRGSGNGPFGQLKAFYGLQSGGGFEDVFD